MPNPYEPPKGESEQKTQAKTQGERRGWLAFIAMSALLVAATPLVSLVATGLAMHTGILPIVEAEGLPWKEGFEVETATIPGTIAIISTSAVAALMFAIGLARRKHSLP